MYRYLFIYTYTHIYLCFICIRRSPLDDFYQLVFTTTGWDRKPQEFTGMHRKSLGIPMNSSGCTGVSNLEHPLNLTLCYLYTKYTCSNALRVTHVFWLTTGHRDPKHQVFNTINLKLKQLQREEFCLCQDTISHEPDTVEAHLDVGVPVAHKQQVHAGRRGYDTPRMDGNSQECTRMATTCFQSRLPLG